MSKVELIVNVIIFIKSFYFKFFMTFYDYAIFPVNLLRILFFIDTDVDNPMDRKRG